MSEVVNNATTTVATPAHSKTKLCKVCYISGAPDEFMTLKCGHTFCRACVKTVFEINVSESKTDVQCLKCVTSVTAREVESIVSREYFQKYLEFSLRRYLACTPNVRTCPAPDCTYAYILEKVSQCEVNHFVCAREGCGREFCYNCKHPWHLGKTCEEARDEVAVNMPEASIPADVLNKMNAKQCPVCHSTIEKMADGSCNQVHCVCCGSDFCWLCGKKITEMHYLSPTGCPLYGAHQWTKRKLWCCRVWMWLLAPFTIFLIAILALPIITVLIPALIGYKVYSCTQGSNKACRVFLTVLFVLLSLLVSPFVALLGALLVLPIGYLYVYGIVPVHLLWSDRHSR